MTRKKVKLAYITNDSARKATFKKRKKGLLKKVSELSTLCGIDAAAIIYSPYETQPDVWPNAAGVHKVISQFKRMPEMEQSKKMVNQESFIRQRIAKASEQLKKLYKGNREKEITELMYQCLTGKSVEGMPLDDLNDMGRLLDRNLKEIYKRMEALKKPAGSLQTPQPPPLPAAPPLQPSPMTMGPPPPPQGAARSSSSSVQGQGQGQGPSLDLAMDGPHRTQWFADWMNNLNDQNMGFGHGEEMFMQFPDNQNFMWSSAFFPDN